MEHFYKICLTLLLIEAVQPQFLQNYGENCTGDSESFGITIDLNFYCDFDKGLTCVEGICQCATDFIYSEQEAECQGLIGSSCRRNTNCVNTAYCRSTIDNPTSHCSCYSEIEEESEDRTKCLSTFEGPCQNDSDCGTSKTPLVCRSGICTCPRSSLGNYYDLATSTCQLTIGSPCNQNQSDADTGNLNCPENSECLLNENGGFSCQCNSEFSVSTFLSPNPAYWPLWDKAFEQCVKEVGIGEPCEPRGAPRNPIKVTCNSKAGLVCSTDERVCRCLYDPDQVWDGDLGACVSELGGICTQSLVNVSLPGVPQLGSLPCASGLQCVIIEEGTLGAKGVCKSLE